MIGVVNTSVRVAERAVFAGGEMGNLTLRVIERV